MRLTDLLPAFLRPPAAPAGQADPPVRTVRLHSPESIAAAAGTPGTLANRVLKGLVTGKPVVAPPEDQDFIDYLGRQLTKQLLDSEKRDVFSLEAGTVTGLAERWSKQPCTLLDSPDVTPGQSIVIRPAPKPPSPLLHTIADPDREIPWTIVVHPEQWDIAVYFLRQCGFDVLNADAPWTPYQ